MPDPSSPQDANGPEPAPPDPDAVGLPPGAVLPDRNAFRRGQLRALVVTNLMGMIALVVWGWLQPDAQVVKVCAVLVGELFLVNLVRWLLAPRA